MSQPPSSPPDAPPASTPPDWPVRSYGRVRGRALRKGRAGLLAERLPGLALDLSDGRLNPRALAPQASEVWLEIGFGAGEHMIGQAAAHPAALILGAEPFVNGQARVVSDIAAAGLDNIRIHPGDARELMAALPDASLDRAFILFPDPWPKARHHKRRLVQEDLVADLARLLRPGAGLRFATDWADYAEWTLERLLRSPHFAWTAARAQDWRTPPADHVPTRYQAKRLGDCEPVFLDFVRR